MKKKLLHVTSSLKIGGAEAVLCDLIAGLGNKDYDHTVIYFHDGPRAEFLRKLGVQLICIKGFVCLYDPVFFVWLFKTIKKFKPDLIHSLLWSANVTSRVIAKLLSINHVSVYHNNIDQDGVVRNFFDKITRKFSKKLIAVSDEVANSIQKQDSYLASGRLVVIKNGIDVQAVKDKACNQAVLPAQLCLQEKNFVIGSVGRFCHVKNYPLLIKSFARLYKKHAHVRLVLCGIGPQEQKLKKLVQSLNLDSAVTFIVGQLAYGYFSLFDCFVQSSNKEGISIALLEALSCGVACISTNVEYYHPVIENNENGLLVKAGDEIALEKALESLVFDERKRECLAKNGHDFVVKRFGLQHMIQRYRAIFKNLLM